MGLVPNGRLQRVEFYEQHRGAWEANAVAIGLTAAQVTALMAKVAAARDQYGKVGETRDAARSANDKFTLNVDEMQDLGMAAIRAIKNKAESTHDMNVYVLAGLPMPTPPAPLPAPGTPDNFRIALLATGALELRWKCANPSGSQGTIYEVQRRIGGEGEPFVVIGGSGTRKFEDGTLPAGTASATYLITAVRSTARGNPAQFTVNFGVSAGGGASISVLGGSAAARGGAYEQAQRHGGGSRFTPSEGGLSNGNGHGGKSSGSNGRSKREPAHA